MGMWPVREVGVRAETVKLQVGPAAATPPKRPSNLFELQRIIESPQSFFPAHRPHQLLAHLRLHDARCQEGASKRRPPGRCPLTSHAVGLISQLHSLLNQSGTGTIQMCPALPSKSI